MVPLAARSEWLNASSRQPKEINSVSFEKIASLHAVVDEIKKQQQELDKKKAAFAKELRKAIVELEGEAPAPKEKRRSRGAGLTAEKVAQAAEEILLASGPTTEEELKKRLKIHFATFYRFKMW